MKVRIAVAAASKLNRYPRIRVVGDGLGLQHLSLSEQKNPAVRQDFSNSQQDLRASGLVQR